MSANFNLFDTDFKTCLILILACYAGLNILVRTHRYILRVLANIVSLVATPDFYVPMWVKIYLRPFFVVIVKKGASGGDIMFLQDEHSTC